VWDDDEPYTKLRRRPVVYDVSDADELGPGRRWCIWDASVAGARGPEPYPDWLVTEAAAIETDLGLLKTGKEADVHLLERAVPETGRGCLLASKRYRSAEHRMFHRDAGYLEGRRVRRSRETRAMATKTAFGHSVVAGQWAAAEFAALVRLWMAGAPVPYPVQMLGTELLLEFIGDPSGEAAPRLVQLDPERAELADLWTQLVEAMVLLARHGLTHGDLSPYNLLVHHGRLYLIDLPQVVDLVVNPQGLAYLRRDSENVARWFARHGVAGADPDQLYQTLVADAGL
jgi:RIO kinase 1